MALAVLPEKTELARPYLVDGDGIPASKGGRTRSNGLGSRCSELRVNVVVLWGQDKAEFHDGALSAWLT